LNTTGLEVPDDRRPGLTGRIAASRLGRSMTGEGLRARVLRGSGWTLAGFVASQLARMASTVVLTRLLFPEAYGIMAMANVYMVGLQMFSDIGIRHSIIQNKRGEDPVFLNTAWTMQVARGFILWFASCAIAYPVSRFYEEPILFPVLCVLGFSAAIKGFQTTAYATANRRLTLGKLTGMELGTHVLGIVVTIVWAYFHPSVWALAGGGVITALISVAVGFRVMPSHRHRLMWEKPAAHEIVRFGRWIFLATVLGFFANNGDRLLLGKFMSTAEFGMYFLALTWVGLAGQVNSILNDRVMIAVYAENQDTDPALVRPKIAKMRLAKAALILPVVAALIIFGDDLVRFMYDARYEGAGWMLQILAVGMGFSAMMTIGDFMLSKGKSKLFMCMVVLDTVTVLGCMALGGYLGGSTGIVIGVAASRVARYPYLIYIYQRFGYWIWKIDFLMIAALGVIVAAGYIYNA
jgi:O-antigen/teichoic acid export membrane protein